MEVYGWMVLAALIFLASLISVETGLSARCPPSRNSSAEVEVRPEEKTSKPGDEPQAGPRLFREMETGPPRWT